MDTINITKRTPEEIYEQAKKIVPDDFFGFQTADLLGYLHKEEIVKFFKKVKGQDFTPNTEWDDQQATPREKIIDYMPFAWNKANNMRGLSSGRSVDHMRAWVWLDGEDELYSWINNDDNYEYYGKPILEKICEHYGVDWKALDNGERTNGE